MTKENENKDSKNQIEYDKIYPPHLTISIDQFKEKQKEILPFGEIRYDLLQQGVSPNASPRQYLFNEKMFIKGTHNQITGEPGAGKSTFMKFLSLRYLKTIKAPVLYFYQEDDFNEDISPFLIKEGYKEGQSISNLYFINFFSSEDVLNKLKAYYQDHKLIVIDPVHSIFNDVSKIKQCREVLQNIDKTKRPNDTIIYINHPKSYYKENKLSGTEINSGTKALLQVVRSSLLLQHHKETDKILIKHTKGYATHCYLFNMVEDSILNKKNQSCSFMNIEDFKYITDKKVIENLNLDKINTALQQRPLTKKRQEIREVVIKTIKEQVNKESDKKRIITSVEDAGYTKKDLEHEIQNMIKDKAINRKMIGRKSFYSLPK